MAVIGGDILEITMNHDTLGTAVFFPKADEAAEIDLGGFKSADEDKGVDMGGNMIDVITQNRWSATAVLAGDLNTREDLEKLQAATSDPVPGTWTIAHVSGAIYRGSGKPVGDVKQALKEATIQLKLAGGGQLKKIA